MSRPKPKRNKPYRKKPVCFPEGIRKMARVNREVDAAVEGIRSGEPTERHLATLQSHTEVARRLYGPSCAASLMETLADVMTRVELGDRNVSVTEQKIILEGFAKIREFLDAQSNVNIVRATSQLLEELEKAA